MDVTGLLALEGLPTRNRFGPSGGSARLRPIVAPAVFLIGRLATRVLLSRPADGLREPLDITYWNFAFLGCLFWRPEEVMD
jgi:hypothetical protein